MPKALLDRVEVEPHLIFVWEAFWSLSGDRHMGANGSGPIPFTAVDRYARRYGIRGVDEFERFHGAVYTLDTAFMKHQEAKLKRQTDEARRLAR